MSAAQRVVTREPDVVGGIGCWLSSFTLAATEVSERVEVPWLSLSYSDMITEPRLQVHLPDGADCRGPVHRAAAAHRGPGDRGEEQQADEGGDRRRQHRRLGVFLEAAAGALGQGPGHQVRGGRGVHAAARGRDGDGAEDPLRPPPSFIVFQSTNVGDDKLLLDKFAERGITPSTVPLIGGGGHWTVPED